VKNPRRKPKYYPAIHFLGTLSDLILGKKILIKYDDPGNQVVTIKI